MKRINATASVGQPRGGKRRGLAPLELVLALPILLLVMAMMINVGSVVTWRVRQLGMARNAVWNNRWPRTGNTDPLPNYWPVNAAPTVADGGNVPELDDKEVDVPVARGRLPGANVNSDLLDPTHGRRIGSADITRNLLMLQKWGSFHLKGNAVLLDDKWQYSRMKYDINGTQITIPTESSRRIPVIYSFDAVPAGLSQAYIDAILAILRSPLRAILKTLDAQDDEFLHYQPLTNMAPPDFNQYLTDNLCSQDDVARQVPNLIDRIQGNPATKTSGVPGELAHRFIDLYNKVIAAYDATGQTPPPGEIDRLNSNIKTLQQFLSQLPGG